MKRALTGLATMIVLTALAVFVAAPAGADPVKANASEQIIFSGTGVGTFGGIEAPFGFWIWCQDAESHTPYAGECNGAMYFYALGITRHVEGEVTEPEEGIYVMSVGSTKPDPTAVHCMLRNASDELMHGPHNTVNVACTAPDGSGTSTTTVVNVTGP